MPLGTIVDCAGDSSTAAVPTEGGSSALGDGSGCVGVGESDGVGAGEGVGDGVGVAVSVGGGGTTGPLGRLDAFTRPGRAELLGVAPARVGVADFGSPVAASDVPGLGGGFRAADGRGAGACAAVVTLPASGGPAGPGAWVLPRSQLPSPPASTR